MLKFCTFELFCHRIYSFIHACITFIYFAALIDELEGHNAGLEQLGQILTTADTKYEVWLWLFTPLALYY